MVSAIRKMHEITDTKKIQRLYVEDGDCDEADVQNSIRLKLSELGYYTERINVGNGYLVPKELMDERTRCPPVLKAKLDKVSYFNTGCGQRTKRLVAIKDGRISFIEVKNEVGKTYRRTIKFYKTDADSIRMPGGNRKEC